MNDQSAAAMAISMITLGVVTTVYFLTRLFARRLRSREVIRAIESGQELPPEPAEPIRGFLADLRAGVLFLAFGLGLGVFLALIDQTVAIAVVPVMLGIGFVVNALLTRRFGDR